MNVYSINYLKVTENDIKVIHKINRNIRLYSKQYII